MKNPSQAAWSRTTGWAAAVVALAATFAVAPSIARATCVGDCNNDGEVTINELINMVNIALETAPISGCMAGDANGDGSITVNEIVAGVNNALNGCPPMGGCGDGVTEAPEECDPGSVCIGGTNAGASCTQESDCQGEGICDTFGQAGTAGTVPRKVCSADNECGGAKCIHCKRFSKNGCANNCTTESTNVTHLVPGQLNATSTDIVPGTSGAIVHGDILTIPLPLEGTTALIAGKPGSNGLIPLAQKVDGTNLNRIPVQMIACACVRGSEYRTCGGTQFDADGKTLSINCTTDATLCDGKKPCTAVAGVGNAGEGVIGCGGLPSDSYEIVQDAGGDKCASDVIGCQFAGPVIFTPNPAAGAAGSQVLASASAIGTVTGLCTGNTADYGPDHEFCTDDDPNTAAVRGTPSIQTLVTGTASAMILGANGFPSPDNDIGPFSITGHGITCDKIAQGMTSGGAQAGAFTSLDQPTTGDIVVTNVFIAQ